MGKDILKDNPNGTDSIFWFHGYNAISDDGTNIAFDYVRLLEDIKKHINSPLTFDARNNYILTNFFPPQYKIDGENIEINGYLSERIGTVMFSNNNIEVEVDVPSSSVNISSFSNIHYYVKFQFSDLLGTNNTKKYAITLYSNNYEDYLKILKHIGLNLTNTGEQIIAKKIHSAMDMAKSKNDYFALNWLYEKAPQTIISSRNDRLLYEDLLLLLKYEEKKVFNNGTGIIKNLSAFKDLSFVYNQFIGLPELVVQIYNQLNKNNRKKFCQIINSFRLLFSETEIIAQKFYVGDKYEFIAHPKPVNNYFYGAIPSDYLNQPKATSPTSKVFLYNDVAYKGSGGAVSPSSAGAAEQSSKDEIQNKPKQTKYEFHPLELVELYYEDVPKSVIMPAIYAKYTADEKEAEEALNSFFIAVNIISLLVSGGLLLNGAKGLVRLFAIADSVTAIIDNFIRTLSDKDKQQLSKIPEGKWFLENWDTINMVVGAGMISTALAQGISKNLPAIIEWLEKRNNSNIAQEMKKILEETKAILKTSNQQLLSNQITDLLKGKTVLQKSSNLDELYKAAKVANEELVPMTKKFAIETEGEAGFRNGLKEKERAIEKINADYEGIASKLLDIAGSKVVYNTVDDLYKALENFHKEYKILKFKDRIQNPLSSGYRDILMNIEMKNGHVVEFRLHLKEIDDATIIGHKLYQQRRILEAISTTRDLTVDEMKTMFKLINAEKELYNNAWEKIINK